MTKRVVGIGEAAIDHLAVVDRYPEVDTQVDLAGLSIQGSGAVANGLATLANFGMETAFAGKLSDDDFGRFVVRGFEGLSIDISGLIVEPDRISPYRFVCVERDTGRRTVLRTAGNVTPLGADEIDLSVLEGADLLIVDGYHFEAQVRATEAARSKGIPVVLDASSVHEGMGELVALSDVLIASERYASEVAPRGEIEDSLLELGRLGPTTVVVTLGEEGSIGLKGDKLVRQPPLPVDVVDTTGAGETYLGGYCYAMLEDLPLERCMQIASAAASLCCRELGSRAGLPTLAEVLESC